jgi:hypothetical protein
VNFSGLAVGVFPKLASSWGWPSLAHRTLSGVHRTVRWIIAESPLEIPEGGEFKLESSGAPDTVRWCTGQSGASRPEGLRLPLCSFVESKTWSFYWLSLNLLHLYNLYTWANLVSPNVCVGQFNHQNYIGTRCKPNSLSAYTCGVDGYTNIWLLLRFIIWFWSCYPWRRRCSFAL